MSSRAPSPRPPEGRHHFRPPDPAALVERPSMGEFEAVGPRPPRPWYQQVMGQWAIFTTLLVMAAGVAVAGAGHWRRGSLIVGGGVLLAAVLRLVLPEKAAGLLVNRRRAIDVAFTAALGAGIVALAWIVAPGRP